MHGLNGNNYSTYFLIVARFIGVTAINPIFNSKIINNPLRIVLSLLFAFMVYPFVIRNSIINTTTLYGFLLVKEVIIGCILGFILGIPFWIIKSIGNIIDVIRGEQLGQIMNPGTSEPSSTIANLLDQAFLAYFMCGNGLIFIIGACLKSFVWQNPTSFIFNKSLLSEVYVISIIQNYMYISVLYATPIILLLIVLEIVLSLISSFMPNLNVTMLSLPLKSSLALFLLIFYVQFLYHENLNLFQIIQKHLFN